ncbi:MAG: oxygen-insensitive NADPH nitroreductase [Neisseria sp.]|nr:oxygen-insensitive NADPH nitroreductase [Neisseria sp.]
MTLHSRPALETALAHRSVRRFTEEPIAPEMLDAILRAGLAASTSSYLFNVSIIRVTDKEKRKELRAVSAAMGGGGHAYVEHCAEYLVFCMDASRHHALAPQVQTDWTEVTLIGAIDAGIMAQNIVLTAESLGLGAVFIGSLRNDMAKVREVLQTPEYVVPLFGVCLGHPNQETMQRPRLPVDVVVSENVYQPAKQEALDEFNGVVKNYYQERSGLDLDWAKQIGNVLGGEVRPEMKAFLNEQGFAKR